MSGADFISFLRSAGHGVVDSVASAASVFNAERDDSGGIFDTILSDTNLVVLIILVVVFVAIILLSIIFIILYWVFCLRRDVLYEEAKHNQRMLKRINLENEKEAQSRLNRPRRRSNADLQAIRGLVGGPLDAPPSSEAFIFQAVPPAPDLNPENQQRAESYVSLHKARAADGEDISTDDDDVDDKSSAAAAAAAAAQVTRSNTPAETSTDTDDDGAHTAHLTNEWQIAFRHFLFYDVDSAWNTKIQHAMLRLPHDWNLYDPRHHRGLERDKERWASALTRRRRLHHVLPGFFPTTQDDAGHAGGGGAAGGAVTFQPASQEPGIFQHSSTAALFPSEPPKGVLVSQSAHNYPPVPPTGPGAHSAAVNNNNNAGVGRPPPSGFTVTQPKPKTTSSAPPLSATSGTQPSGGYGMHDPPTFLPLVPTTDSSAANTRLLDSTASPGSVAQSTAPGSGYGFWPSPCTQDANPFITSPPATALYPAPAPALGQRRVSLPATASDMLQANATMTSMPRVESSGPAFAPLPPHASAQSSGTTPPPPSGFKVGQPQK